ncbi:unnamed protein product [Phytomonas sp. EM1]|nr:unnamed protein product [Phytomonas sp. EM1]|eukprot:CCW64216.1 unnamed protein product [Phytomonas sp. isolate EM1]
MYNNITATSVKGTGLSGYVQRSKAIVGTRVNRFSPNNTSEAKQLQEATINPLMLMRSQKENHDMALRLQLHKAIRAVKLKVYLYKEEQLTAGADASTVERECEELYRALMEVAMENQREIKKAHEKKTASQFAAAFGVKESTGAIGRDFDRAQREEIKQAAEEERRKQLEHQLAERLKKVRQENE